MSRLGLWHRPPGGERGRCALWGRCNLDHLGLRLALLRRWRSAGRGCRRAPGWRPCSHQRTCGGPPVASARAAPAAPPPPGGCRRSRPEAIGGVVGEDAHNPCAALDLLVHPLQQVGTPDLFPVGLREVAERQYVLLGLVQWPPADFVYSAAALGKRSASEAARSSQRASLSWANTLRKAAVTMPW
jgi:hypothetical protein